METVVSRDLRSGRFFIIAFFVLLFLFFIANRYIESFYNPETNLAIAFFVLISSAIFFVFDNAKTVSFDKKSLYVLDKSGYKMEVPLENLEKIKLTMTRINHSSIWKIIYRIDIQNTNSVRLLPKEDEFETFLELVKREYPKVKIQRWSHSFDINQ